MRSIVLISLLAFTQAYLKLDFEKTRKISDELMKRADNDSFTAPLMNGGELYTVQIAVGTPPQNLTVQLDTGSSDLWFVSASNPYCKNNKKYAPKKQDLMPITSDDGFPTSPNQVPKALRNINCNKYGFFNASGSSTYSRNDTNFSLSYGDETFASGPWGTDTISLNGVKVENVTFGLASFSNSTNPVFGIGLPGDESTYAMFSEDTNGTTNTQYSNFPLQLKQQGKIDKVAYSIYLNSTKSKQGSILFGAVDHSKYSGPLYTLPIVNRFGHLVENPYELEVTLSGLGLQGATSNITLFDQLLPALLDTGTTYTYMPSSVAQYLANQTNGVIDKKTSLIKLAKCPSKKSNDTIVFNFSGAQIKIKMVDFVEKHKGKCYLPCVSQESSFFLLGDSFMRHVYTVFDLDDKEISIAQANFNSTKEDIEEISSTVPSAVKAPQYYSSYIDFPTEISVTGDIFAPQATEFVPKPNNTNNKTNFTQDLLDIENMLLRRHYENRATTLSTSLPIFLIALSAVTALFL
ncbi:uncharacterized protein CGFF_03502 [Nakaseomyces glabratus]|nr:Peptidase family A1 domain profile [Nakaseomyces glabratus]QNG13116.1 YPS5 [Nakaseomyces glabratus]SCV15944.1 uncharacterized protein CGFF_03502 [Nakaseomyces glabratus]SLM15576.1 uncharacterized protein CGFF_03502 [Nakaseomyces glabratus]